MNVEILQENIVSTVNIINRFVSNKSSLPVFSNVLLDATDLNLKLLGSNLETSVEIVLPVKINETGKAAVPAAEHRGQSHHLASRTRRIPKLLCLRERKNTARGHPYVAGHV